METKLVRRRRKTLSLRITPEGNLEIRAPMGMPAREIEAFVTEKARWIEIHRAQVLRDFAQGRQAPLEEEAIRELKRQTKEKLTPMLAFHARRMGVSYGSVTVRCQQTRWGSCSGAGNLNFNCLLALAPDNVMEYVAVHELAHRKQMNHSAAFWQEVAREFPGYAQARAWLKQNGGGLLARARQGKDRG